MHKFTTPLRDRVEHAKVAAGKAGKYIVGTPVGRAAKRVARATVSVAVKRACIYALGLLAAFISIVGGIYLYILGIYAGLALGIVLSSLFASALLAQTFLVLGYLLGVAVGICFMMGGIYLGMFCMGVATYYADRVTATKPKTTAAPKVQYADMTPRARHAYKVAHQLPDAPASA